MSKFYRNFFFLSLLVPLLLIQMYMFSSCPFLDLPADAKLEDMDLLAGLDLSKLSKVEESGERCFRKIQEYLVHDVSSTNIAILPEDKLQKLAVGVSFGICSILHQFKHKLESFVAQCYFAINSSSYTFRL